AAPEQADGRFDRRADLHAVGVVTHELLRGRRFERGAAFGEAVPPLLATTVNDACSPAPEGRPPTAARMQTVFETIQMPDAIEERRALVGDLFAPNEIAWRRDLDVVEDADGEATQPLRPERPRRRRSLWVGLGLALAASGFAAAAVHASRRG